MGRIIATVVVVAALAGAVFYYNSLGDRALREAQEKRVAEFQRQAETLRQENERLKTALAKVQSEESSLAAESETLNKAISQYKATGRMPSVIKLPYPPK